MADSEAEAPTLVISADIRRLEAQMTRALKSTEKAMDAMAAKASSAEKKLTAIFGKSEIGKGFQEDFAKLRVGVLDKATESMGGYGAALEAIGPAGLAAAAGIAAVAIAADKAIQAAEWAESLKRTSETLGESTTKLQEWDFAMSAMGIGNEKGRESLEGLNTVIGRLEKGLVKSAKGPQVRLFESILGVNSLGEVQQQLRQLGDVNAVMAKIQAYSRDQSPTQRAAIASVTKIDPDVLTSIADANDKIGDLIQTAHRFGVIADQDLVAKAAAAAEKLHTVSTIIDDEVKISLAGLATPLANAAMGFLHIAQRIGDVIDGARSSLDPLQKMLDKLRQIPGAGGIVDSLGGKGVGDGLMKYVAGAYGGPAATVLGPLVAVVKAFAAVGAQRRQAGDLMQQGADAIHDADDHPKPGKDDPPPKGGHHGADHSGSTIAEANVRYLEALVRATEDLDKQHAAHLLLIAAQYDLAKAHADEEGKKNPKVGAALTNAAGLTRDADLTEEAHRYADAQTEQARKFTDEIVKQYDAEIEAHKRSGEAADRAADAQLRGLDAEDERLHALEALARTAKARKAIAEQLLINEQAKASIQLQRAARHDGFDPAPLQASLDATGAAKRTGLDEDYAGPIAKFARDSTSDLGTELQDSAVTAMKTLNAGLAEAISNGKSLHDVLKNALKKGEGDLVNKGLEAGEGALLGGLGAGAKPAAPAAAAPGAGSFASTLGSFASIFKLFGFARGTSSAPGGPSIVGEHGPEIRNLGRGDSITSNSGLRSLLAGGGGLRAAGGDTHVSVSVANDMRGNSSTAEVMSMLAASEARTQSSTYDAVRRAQAGNAAQYQSEEG
jgi:hypothetical protein